MKVKYYFDVCDVKGAEVEPVDVITFGSPCQDLSIAGKRAGLKGERSGLFTEAVRIIKEMRKNDEQNGRASDAFRPRFAVWENVPVAFSSHKGEDFRAVLEELARVADETVSISKVLTTKRKCPRCGGFLVQRKGRYGQFWGCTNYPVCEHTEQDAPVEKINHKIGFYK